MRTHHPDASSSLQPRRSSALSPITSDITDMARTLPDFDCHEQVVRAIDESSGLHAIVAIHDTILGPALGGCRIWPYPSETEAIIDALRLSRGMTYKAVLAGLPLGGGKSVILGNPKTDKTKALFRSFGRVLEAFEGKYVSSEDVGTSIEDVDQIAEETRYVVGGHRGHGGDPSLMTAYGVHIGLRVAVRHRLGRETAEGLTVAVQGLGHVGYHLCERLHREGARLIVADIDPDAVARAEKDFLARSVPPSEIFAVEADVFAPCALGGALNDETIRRLSCAVIAGSANNQLLEEGHGEDLRRRGVLYAPDYVINAGGLIGVSLELTPEGYDRRLAMRMTERIGPTLAELFERSDEEGVATNLIANTIAKARISAHRQSCWTSPSPRSSRRLAS